MKNKISFLFTLSLLLIGIITSCQTNEMESDTNKKSYPPALVSFNDYKNLVLEIEEHRLERLINLDAFIELSKEENTIILDTRSKFRYDRKHLKGAKHLEFTQFTQANLNNLIPNRNTKILIYCNNNFDGDQIDFASKSFSFDNKGADGEILPNRKPIMLALNIPTYLNLYGYGYKNVFELDELVNVGDQRIEFEGSEVKSPPLIQLININSLLKQHHEKEESQN